MTHGHRRTMHRQTPSKRRRTPPMSRAERRQCAAERGPCTAERGHPPAHTANPRRAAPPPTAHHRPLPTATHRKPAISRRKPAAFPHPITPPAAQPKSGGGKRKIHGCYRYSRYGARSVINAVQCSHQRANIASTASGPASMASRAAGSPTAGRNARLATPPAPRTAPR